MSLTLTDITATVPDGTGTRTILDSINLTIDPGDTVVLTGPSGSGKSTLLAIASLLRRPESGRVLIDGTDVTDLSPRRQAAVRGRSIGIVYQTPNLFPSLTASEQLELVAHLSGHLDDTARRRARDLLVTVGLEHRLNARPAQMSGGERQRVGLARALMNRPSVLMADEPTSALDPERGQQIMELLHDTARDAATLIVTHSADQVVKPDRHLELDHGHLRDLTI
ncbi:MAG: ABC transporter ATP-binding protein [Ilumatobacter coccineus]|uniref:ABC transporter ATP-binding protein n=1 Tax=Ilumatobacter coccineus TaxID=467094 RepID=A0A2G6KCH1_9ACTN|nr:MAG: ABC transporter ATP-binding protein [Ilumatobacter coccineus]